MKLYILPLAAAAAMLVPRVARAQRGKLAPEFTRQGLLIQNFTALSGADRKLGRKAGDAVRSRVAKLSNKSDVDVVSGGDIHYQYEQSGMNADTVLDLGGVRTLARYLRADELVEGTVARSGTGYRLGGWLMLVRDPRLREPLPPSIAPELDAAAEQLARAIVAERAQLRYERRCENALRDGETARAVEQARAGVSASPRGVIARVCLLWALRARGTPSAEVLAVAREILDIDSANAHGLEAAAVALDSLHRRAEAADAWLRLAATDTANLELTQRVVFAMAVGGNARAAEPLIVRAADAHPDSLSLARLEWRVAYENRHWPLAIGIGERLLAADSLARRDSTFFLRLASAYRANAQPLLAVSLAARGAAAFPADAKLYTLYSQLVKAEADTVVPRGLALFPGSAELHAMSANELRARGQLAEAVQAVRTALAIDSTLDRGELLIAQGEADLGRMDSALVSLHRALTRGEDTTLVAQFALGRGNALLRAANGTRARDDYRLAMRFLALADSIRRTPQTAFLMGVAAYSITQSALTDAPKMSDKPHSCELSRLGAETLPLARDGLQAGQEVSPEAAKQFLDYLGQLEPYVGRQIDAFCGADPTRGAPGKNGS